MISRLPTPGADDGAWGAILNDYLLQAHTADGSLRSNSVSASQIADGALPQAKIQDLTTDLAAKVNTSAIGSAGGVAALNTSGTIPVSQLPSVATGGIYPLSEYGFFSASAAIESFTAHSTISSLYLARIFVPAGYAIHAIATVISVAGTLGAGGGNCFVLYDSSGNLVAATPTDDSLWQTNGMKVGVFSTPIPAQSTDRFVYGSPFIVGYNGTPYVAYNVVVNAGLLTGGYNKPNHRRAFYANGLSAYPVSFNPATYGTESNYLPFVALG